MEAVAPLTLYSPPMSSSLPPSRRNVLKQASAALGAGAVISMASKTPARAQGASSGGRKNPFVYCLNTSTIRGHKQPLMKEIELAAKAGYTAMEPWIMEINEHAKGGGNVRDLKKAFADNGITVSNAIGFAPWIVGDDQAR